MISIKKEKITQGMKTKNTYKVCGNTRKKKKKRKFGQYLPGQQYSRVQNGNLKVYHRSVPIAHKKPLV